MWNLFIYRYFGVRHFLITSKAAARKPINAAGFSFHDSQPKLTHPLSMCNLFSWFCLPGASPNIQGPLNLNSWMDFPVPCTNPSIFSSLVFPVSEGIFIRIRHDRRTWIYWYQMTERQRKDLLRLNKKKEGTPSSSTNCRHARARPSDGNLSHATSKLSNNLLQPPPRENLSKFSCIKMLLSVFKKQNESVCTHSTGESRWVCNNSIFLEY
jgi:hypothetical protein